MLNNNIDSKIKQQAVNLLNNIRFSQESLVDYNKYNNLLTYRTILENIQYFNECLCGVDTTQIISKINKITNSIC